MGFFWELGDSSNCKNVITDLPSEYNVLHDESSIEMKWELFQTMGY